MEISVDKEGLGCGCVCVFCRNEGLKTMGSRPAWWLVRAPRFFSKGEIFGSHYFRTIESFGVLVFAT